jgi:hypothetical protein
MGWVATATPRLLYPRERPRYPLYEGLGVSQDQYEWVRKISPLPESDHRTVQPVVSRYTDFANPTHNIILVCICVYINIYKHIYVCVYIYIMY